jgi:hypothetical protein
MLERVIGLSNDVGLLSEDYHVPTRQLIGNIPPVSHPPLRGEQSTVALWTRNRAC